MDAIKTKTLNRVVVQENGIIRNEKGYLIGRLVSEVNYASEHIVNNSLEALGKATEIMPEEKKEGGVNHSNDLINMGYNYALADCKPIVARLIREIVDGRNRDFVFDHITRGK